MKLLIDDETIDNPSSRDFARALPDGPADPDRIVTLQNGDDELDAEAAGDGKFSLTVRDGDKTLIAERSLDAHAARQVFELYRSGDPAWRTTIDWKEWKAPAASTNSTWTIREVGMLLGGPAILIAIAIMSETVIDWFANLPLPSFLDSTAARIALGFFVACVGLFVVALVAKVIETRRTSRWAKTTGRIVISKPGFALSRTSDTDIPRNERAADITYEYQVAGRTHRGSRISLAEKIGEDEVPGLLAKYPEGKVVTVYYDPAIPTKATLERDLPTALLFGCLGMLAGGLVIIAGIMYAATIGPDMLQRTFPNAILPLVFIFGIGAALLLLIGVGSLQQIRAASAWPKAMGTVTKSDIHRFEKREDNSGSSSRRTRIVTQYMPIVEYDFKVAGKTYASRAIRLDTEMAGSEAYARKLAASYPVGKIVQVRYDPANPQRTALEIKSGLAWGLLAGGIALLLLAWWATGTLTGSRPWPER